MQGIHRGDPLIDSLKHILDMHSIDIKETKLSGAKKGDGDLHTKNLLLDIAFDGKYTELPKVNPSFKTKELRKITDQAKTCTRIGVLVNNYQSGIAVCLELEEFVKILSALQDVNHDKSH